MKKIFFSLVLMAISIGANAASSSTATLSNFSLTTITGNGYTLVPGSFTMTLYATAYAYDSYNSDSNSGNPFTLSVSATNGDSYSAAFQDINGSITSTSGAAGGFGSSFGASTATTYIDYSYKKDTLLLFSADVLLAGYATGNDSSSATASLGLYTANANGIFNDYTTIGSTTYADTLITNNYSGSKSLYFYFYDNQDHSIRVSALVNTYSIGGTATAVPEPESFTMMLVGVGLMGFITSRRKT